MNEHMFDSTTEHQGHADDLDLVFPPDAPRDGFDLFCREVGGEQARHLTPEIATRTPDTALFDLVSGVDRDDLSGFDLVNLMKAQARLVAHLQGELMTTIAAMAYRSDPGHGVSQAPFEYVADEVAAALRCTRRGGETQVYLALQLSHFPQVLKMLVAGDIDLYRAGVIIETTRHLSTESANDVVDRVIASAPELTAGQLRARLTRLCMEACPQDAMQRLETGIEQRRVIVSANHDGTANLLLLSIAPEQAMAARRRINRLARRLKTKGDTRNSDQRRADVALDLLLAGSEEIGNRAHVDIVVDLGTLVGLNDAPGEIPGFGPVVAEIARNVVDRQHGAKWDYTIIHNGEAVDTGTLRRRPKESQRRTVISRHPTCIFPGCRMPARDSDLDHRQDYARGGPTSEANLAPLCRHHHRLKHRSPWKVKPLGPGEYEWVSRLGHEYRVSPDRASPVPSAMSE